MSAGRRSILSWRSEATRVLPPEKSAPPLNSADLAVIERSQAFDALVDCCEEYTAEELSKRYGLSFAEAETLNPALLGLPDCSCTKRKPSR